MNGKIDKMQSGKGKLRLNHAKMAQAIANRDKDELMGKLLELEARVEVLEKKLKAKKKD